MQPRVPSLDPDQWLDRARAGDGDARDQLLGWAYATARHYYVGKVPVEAAMTTLDAEELAGSFFLEFQRAWPRIRVVHRYTRKMLRNNLQRYLREKKTHQLREVTVEADRLDERQVGCLPLPEPALRERWGDREALQLMLVDRTLATCDPLTRELMQLRCSDPPLSYAVISVRLGCTETALRMRAARFYTAVRSAWSATEYAVDHSPSDAGASRGGIRHESR